jgi:UDP-N-acetylglucosamine 2-epimerase (non-hydrolysing)
MAPLVHALARDPDFEAKVCVTAQHREMLDQVLTLFSIVPDYDLNIMKPGQGLTEITCRILQELKPILESFKPDVVLVHGDTTTTVATSLAAFYQRIPVGHVEAGLRTGNLYSPWPEEANRTLTGHLAMYHFAPTENSRQNLLRENIADNKIFVTGNTVIDALIWVRDRVLANELQSELTARYPFLSNGKKPFWSPATVAKALVGVLSKSAMRWLRSPRKTKTYRLSIRCISTLTSASR